MRYRFLKIIFLLSIACVLTLPFFTFLYLYPAVNDELLENIEVEASKLAYHFAKMVVKEDDILTKDSLPRKINQTLNLMQEEFELKKVKIFSPTGETIYSSDAADIGTVNAHDYFHNQVSKGIPYSKIVEKNTPSLEGQIIRSDVVETYVPLMRGNQFRGAFEVYYDITDRRRSLDRLMWRSVAIIFSVTSLLLLVVLFSLWKLRQSMLARDRVENELSWHRDQLEEIVRERTLELIETNKELTRDIEKRRQAEKSLRESEEKYRRLIETANDAIFVTDSTTGLIIGANKKASELIGRPVAEIVGLHQSELHPRGEEERYRQIFAEHVATGTATTEEIFVRHAGGRLIPVEISASMTEWEGKVIIQGIFRDVTERRRAAEELQKAQKLESIGVLAGGIAHDFNNLLTAILGNITLARMRADSPDRAREKLGEAEKAAIRAKELTAQLMTFARGSAPLMKVVHLGLIASEVAKLVLHGSETVCQQEIQQDLWPVEADEGQISQVIHNLVINAVQAMPDGGTITIRAQNVVLAAKELNGLDAGQYVRVDVIDQGTGIRQHELSRIFDPYFTTKELGSGLGLSSSYSIIKKHGGLITVNSRYGKGATFTIYLPASTGKGHAVEAREEKIIRGEGRVLLMDDEEMVREVATDILNDLGYEVGLAVNGQEAIDKYAEALEAGQPYDIVIMDLTVPGGMGGKEAVGHLRKLDPELKAVVSSGYAQEAILENYRQYGFDSIAPKPYKIEELSMILHDLMSRDAESGQAED